MKGTIGPAPVGERLLDRPRGLVRSGEGDAGDARIVDERRADRAARREGDAARRRGTPASCRSSTAEEGDERRLLGGFGDHRIAGRERGRDLAGENRERKIPRADAGEDAAAPAASACCARRSALAELGRPDELPARLLA